MPEIIAIFCLQNLIRILEELPYSMIQTATTCICMGRVKGNDIKASHYSQDLSAPLDFKSPLEIRKWNLSNWLQENITQDR
jgi:hypothetical protein